MKEVPLTVASAGSAKQAEALRQLAGFPLLDALYGRRARRVALGAQIPGRAARLRVASRPDAPLRPRAHGRAHVDGGHHRLALLDHPQRPLQGRTWRTTRRAPPAAPSRRPPASTPPSCSSRTTRGPGSSRPVTPARSSTRADEEITVELMVDAPRRAAREALGRAHQPPARGALPRGPQHLVRERAGLAARDPCRRPRPAHPRRADVPHAERLLPHGRRERPADPRHGALPRPRGRGRPVSAQLLRPVHAGGDHRRARMLVLRRCADAAGHGPRRVDVRRRRPLHDAGCLGRPGGPRPRLPLRRGRALVGARTRPASRASSRRSALRTTRT